jgi:hypothetical protein
MIGTTTPNNSNESRLGLPACGLLQSSSHDQREDTLGQVPGSKEVRANRLVQVWDLDSVLRPDCGDVCPCPRQEPRGTHVFTN